MLVWIWFNHFTNNNNKFILFREVLEAPIVYLENVTAASVDIIFFLFTPILNLKLKLSEKIVCPFRLLIGWRVISSATSATYYEVASSLRFISISSENWRLPVLSLAITRSQFQPHHVKWDNKLQKDWKLKFTLQTKPWSEFDNKMRVNYHIKSWHPYNDRKEKINRGHSGIIVTYL